ncbi:MAG: DegT/DnrJ/EryC1/StrS family aminotransferase [Actinobacteria bacterium]|nr:MAG: DegT/DnrJ/EryC1/StrS family aminotransferase [Actinomycetota bacterium]
MIPFVDLVAQYKSIAGEVDRAFHEVTASAQYILGARVERFEEEFAAFVGVDHAVGVGSGLDALRLGLLALEVGRGDEVILPANTYIATALAVSEVGADVVLVDCDPETYNIDPAAVASALRSRTRALLPVHFTGQAAEMRPLLELAASNSVEVVEDAAQAHGALYEGRPCGSLGKVACFSFYPGKNLGAYGDGGMVTTSDPVVVERTRRLRNYGERAKYDHVVKGVNSRLDGLQAAFLSVKLPHLASWNEARLRHADMYTVELEGVGDLGLQKRSPSSTHVYHLFVVETAERDALRDSLAERGIQTGIHYPIPIHLQEAYSDLRLGPGAFPHAERLAHETLSLPMYPELTEEQIRRVTDAIREFFASGRPR